MLDPKIAMLCMGMKSGMTFGFMLLMEAFCAADVVGVATLRVDCRCSVWPEADLRDVCGTWCSPKSNILLYASLC